MVGAYHTFFEWDIPFLPYNLYASLDYTNRRQMYWRVQPINGLLNQYDVNDDDFLKSRYDPIRMEPYWSYTTELLGMGNEARSIRDEEKSMIEEVVPGYYRVDFSKYFKGKVSFNEFALSIKENFSIIANHNKSLFNTTNNMLRAIRDRVAMERIIFELSKTWLRTYVARGNRYFTQPLRGCRSWDNTADATSLYEMYWLMNTRKAPNTYTGTFISNDYGYDPDTFISENVALNMGYAVMCAIQALQSNGTPPFDIPKEFGGGRKYLCICSRQQPPFANNLIDPDLVFRVNAHETLFYYNRVFSAAPPLVTTSRMFSFAGPMFIVGYPGILRFAPTKDYQVELKSSETNYARLVDVGWSDVSMYKSAMSPWSIPTYEYDAAQGAYHDYATIPSILGDSLSVVAVDVLRNDAPLHLPGQPLEQEVHTEVSHEEAKEEAKDVVSEPSVVEENKSKRRRMRKK